MSTPGADRDRAGASKPGSCVETGLVRRDRGRRHGSRRRMPVSTRDAGLDAGPGVIETRVGHRDPGCAPIPGLGTETRAVRRDRGRRHGSRCRMPVSMRGAGVDAGRGVIDTRVGHRDRGWAPRPRLSTTVSTQDAGLDEECRCRRGTPASTVQGRRDQCAGCTSTLPTRPPPSTRVSAASASARG